MTKNPPAKQKFKTKTARLLMAGIWAGALFPALLLTLLFLTQSEDELPSVEMLENPPELLASIVLADDSKTELGRYWSVNRTNVEYKDISPYVIDALISTEDERYFDHSGIDLRAVARAVVKAGSAGGASTISQQLAKLVFTLQERARKSDLKTKGEVEAAPSRKIGRIQKRLNEKVKENIIAIRLESRYTKEEIITMYLNQFDFLYNAVGIKNAAKVYFNKKPIDLTKSEAAMLVGMCKNPSLYNPYTYQIKDYRSRAAKKNNISLAQVTSRQMQELRTIDSSRTLQRRNQVLYQWKKNTLSGNEALKSSVNQDEYDSLKTKPLITNYQIVDHKEGLAPYFRESLRSELSRLFKSTGDHGELIYKNEKGEAYNLYKDGLRIYTTINFQMQKHAENALKRHLKEDLQPEFDKNNRNLRNFPFTNRISDKVAETLINSGRKNSERYRSLKLQGASKEDIEESFNLEAPMKVFSWEGDVDTVMTPNDSLRYYKGILRAGLISVEPSTGFVKAWVGGIDFNHFAYDHVKQGTRQVGSTIKPFVYATAITMGVVKPCTTFPYGSSACVDVFNNGRITKQWCPKGQLTPSFGTDPSVEWCLTNSNNPGTVLVMSKMGGQAGPKNISKLLKDLDIILRPEDEVPSMCLGVMDLSLFQMVGAQSMFVNKGIYVRPSTILRIEDRNGNVIYSADPYSKEVLNSSDAFVTLKMMKGVIQSGTGASLRGGRKWGGITHPTAGKTGTTQNNSDGWFMGLTPDLVTGVWVGAEDRAVRFKSMTWGQGARMALPIYGYYMQQVYKDTKLKVSTEDFEAPIGYNPSIYYCDEPENNYDLITF